MQIQINKNNYKHARKMVLWFIYVYFIVGTLKQKCWFLPCYGFPNMCTFIGLAINRIHTTFVPNFIHTSILS